MIIQNEKYIQILSHENIFMVVQDFDEMSQCYKIYIIMITLNQRLVVVAPSVFDVSPRGLAGGGLGILPPGKPLVKLLLS